VSACSSSTIAADTAAAAAEEDDVDVDELLIEPSPVVPADLTICFNLRFKESNFAASASFGTIDDVVVVEVVVVVNNNLDDDDEVN
jgi:hypothetical protein